MIYNAEDTIKEGSHRYRKAGSLNKEEIMQCIKSGIQFTDDVLSNVGIRKRVNDAVVYNEVVRHDKEKLSKKLKKDNINLKNLNNIEIIVNDNDDVSEYAEKETTTENIETDDGSTLYGISTEIELNRI